MGSNLERVVEQEVKGTVGVRYGEEFFLNSRGMKLFTCRWLPLGKEVRALIFLCHGYGMECSIYMKGVGIRLAQAGYAVFGIDIEGHGKSEGLRCFINNFDCVIDDCVSFFKSVRDRDEYKGKPTFLYGESMGGALALLIHRKEPGSWNGAVLVAPMCKISEKLKPPELVTSILRKLAYVVPTWKIVPSRDIIETGFKNPLKREQIRSNPYIYQDRPRLKTAMELLNASMGLEERLDEVTIPFLVLHGEDDSVTDPDISKDLYEMSQSRDKTIKLYAGMWHGLTFGEPEDNAELVFRNVVDWLDERTKATHSGMSELNNMHSKEHLSHLFQHAFERARINISTISGGALLHKNGGGRFCS